MDLHDTGSFGGRGLLATCTGVCEYTEARLLPTLTLQPPKELSRLTLLHSEVFGKCVLPLEIPLSFAELWKPVCHLLCGSWSSDLK